jgi:hypothetical protein
MAVALVGTPTSIVATGAGSYAAETGTDRIVIAVCIGEAGATSNRPLASGTYGTVANTGMVGQTVSPSGSSGRMTIGILYWNEAAVASRSSDVLDTVWTGGDPASGTRAYMYTFSGVDQTTPIDASTSNNAAATTSLGMSLTTTASGLVVAGACHHAQTVSVPWATVTAVDSTEYFDENLTAFRGSTILYDPALGGTSYSETVSPASAVDLSIAAASINAAASGTTRGQPFGMRGTAFNGGRIFSGPIN